MARSVVVAGATGLVGREIIRLLEAKPDVTCTALVRRAGALGGDTDQMKELVFDYDDPQAYEQIGTIIPCDVILCALGTTIGAAGSQQAFRKVDLDYPAALMRRAARLEQRPVFGVVSAAGAGHPRGFYLGVKAEMERSLVDSGLPYVICRPSLLLGEREEFRLAERMGGLLAKPYLWFIRIAAPETRWLWKYAPIDASRVAAALVRTCVEEPPLQRGRVLQGLTLHHPILELG